MSKVKDKEIILKAPREGKILLRNRTPTRISSDFSAETAGQKEVA